MKSGNYCSKGVQKVARTLQDLLTISTPQIVIAEHHDGDFCQIQPEHPLAAGIEAIAVDQRENRSDRSPPNLLNKSRSPACCRHR